jgi:hypothetical protein
MIFYCSQCFSKTEYKFSKPNFCQKCGASASSGKKTLDAGENNSSNMLTSTQENSKRVISKPVKYENVDEYIDDDEFEVDYVPRIKPGAGVSVEKSPSIKKITFGEAVQAGSASNNIDFKLPRNQDSGLSKSFILEQFKKEASNSKNFNDIN